MLRSAILIAFGLHAGGLRGQTAAEAEAAFREIWSNTPASARISSDEEAVRVLPGIYVTSGIDTWDNLYLFPDHTYINEACAIGRSQVLDDGEWRFDEGLIRFDRLRAAPNGWTGTRFIAVPWRLSQPRNELVLLDEHFLWSLKNSKVPAAGASEAVAAKRLWIVIAPTKSEPITPETTIDLKRQLARVRSYQVANAWSEYLGFSAESVVNDLDYFASAGRHDPRRTGFGALVLILAFVFLAPSAALLLGVAALVLGWKKARHTRSSKGAALGCAAVVIPPALILLYEWEWFDLARPLGWIGLAAIALGTVGMMLCTSRRIGRV